MFYDFNRKHIDNTNLYSEHKNNKIILYNKE